MRKLKIRKNYKISKILLGVLFLVFFLTFILFKIYSDNISPKIIGIANLKLKRFTESFLSNNIGYDILNSDVIDDILGKYPGNIPKFVKQYANIKEIMKDAISKYNKDVKTGEFPTKEYSFNLTEEERDKLEHNINK